MVYFQFGSGETAYFVILELYAGGNVVLTDCYYVVLNVLRTHSKDADALVRVGRVYPSFETRAECDNQGGQQAITTVEGTAANSHRLAKPSNPQQMLTWIQKQVSQFKLPHCT